MPEDEKMERTSEILEKRAERLIEQARRTDNRIEKATALKELGDTRYIQYLNNRQERYRKLSANCYLAAEYLRIGQKNSYD